MTIVAAAFASPGRPQPAAKGLAFAFAPMCVAFLVANPYALLDRAAFIDGLQKQTRRRPERGRREARPRATHGLALLPADVHVGLRLAAFAARARRDRRADRAPPAARRSARPGADPAVPLLRPTVALLRALDAADLPDPGDARRRGRSSRWPTRWRPRVLVPALAALALLQAARVQRPQRRRARPRRHAAGRARLDAAEHPDRHEDRRWSRSRPTSGRPTPGVRCSAIRRAAPAPATAGTSARRRARALQRPADHAGAARWSSSRTTSARCTRRSSSPTPTAGSAG